MKVLKRVEEEKSKIVNFRATQSQINAMKEKAEKYTGGDMAKWIRFASMDYVPSQDQLIEVKDKKKEA